MIFIYLKKKQTFCGFSMGRNQYWAGRFYDLCVYYMTGTPEGSTVNDPLAGFVSYTSCQVFVVMSCLFFVALWSPAGKGLTSWLSCALYFITFPNVFWSTSESRVRLAP